MRKYVKVLMAGTVILGATSFASAEDVEINYWMWDGNQAPVYRKCADAFEAANPGIKIKITQDGWENYWTTLTTSFVSGGTPDVFVNHLTRFPEFVANGILTDLTPLIAQDKVDLSIYKPGLAEAWNKDGKQWGLPKDWDTIALVYEKKAVTDAGLTEDELKSLAWNPDDGGTFEKAVAKLTIDANGKRGDDPAFDKSNVAKYGYISANSVGTGFGQVEWSPLAVSAGFKYIDQPFGKKFLFDSPALLKTLIYLRDLALVKGYAISQEKAGNLGAGALFLSGKLALSPQGSWSIAQLQDTAPGPIGFAPVPIGPEGRKSMLNGLSDAISASSPHQAEAWKWVKYLGSAACQDVVGQSGVVFPAIPSGTEAAFKAHQAKGLDVSAFTGVATPETTFAFPLSDHGSEIAPILQKAVDQVLLGQGDPAEALKAGTDEANALLQ